MVGAVNVGMDIGGTKTHVLARRGAEIVVDEASDAVSGPDAVKTIFVLVLLALCGWAGWRRRRDAEDPPRLIVRLLVTTAAMASSS